MKIQMNSASLLVSELDRPGFFYKSRWDAPFFSTNQSHKLYLTSAHLLVRRDGNKTVSIISTFYY